MTDYVLKEKTTIIERWTSIKEFAKKNLLVLFYNQEKYGIDDDELEDLIDLYG